MTHAAARFLALALLCGLTLAAAGGADAQTISGNVSSSGGPLDGATVCFFDTSRTVDHCTTAGPDGSYVSDPLTAGDYVVEASLTGFVAQYYDGVAALGFDDPFVLASHVTVATGDTGGIDFVLAPGFTISGTITAAASGDPIADGDFCVYQPDKTGVICGSASSDGTYTTDPVPAGDYIVEGIGSGFVRQYYNGVDALGFGDPRDRADTVTVGPADVTGVDFALVAGFTISGTITAADSGEPIADGEFCVYRADKTGVMCDSVSSDGTYTTDPVPAGDYIVEGIASGFVRQYYNGVDALGSGDPRDRADTVTVGPADVTGVDFALVTGFTISGFITNGDLGQPAADANACVFDDAQVFVACATPDASGLYQTQPLPPGDYVVQATAPDLIGEYWNDVPDGDAGAFDTAARIRLGDSPVSGISFILAASRVGNLTTVAGGGDGGQATAASFPYPNSVAVDAAGNLYIADESESRVRRVDAATGTITTVAGTGVAGFSSDGGPATAASLYYPTDVAVDAAGNLYIVEPSSYRVRRVDAATGTITTVAGNEARGFSGDGGPATAASLYYPNGIAVDAAGNLYIACASRVRRVDAATGIITTVAGNGALGFSGDGGPATAASLYYPTDLAVDAAGNLYITDRYNHRVRRVDAATGTITTVAGNGTAGFSGDGGPATAASLLYPYGVAVDATGNLFIGDSSTRIRRVEAGTGIITTVAGNGASDFSGDGGLATAASLYNPRGIAVGATGDLFIADLGHRRIRRVEAATGLIATVAGNGTSGFGGDGGPATAASLYYPADVALDAAGNLYIADRNNERVRRVDVATGLITTVAGNGTSGFSGDGGSATAASLGYPFGVAVDAAGNLYVADQYNNRVRRVEATTGIITTIAGNGTAGFSGDGGPATAASLYYPTDVAVDAAGNLYVADQYNDRVRRVEATTGIITTIAGNGTSGFSGDGGPATAAGLTNPTDLTVDAAGNLYIACQQRIRRVDATTGTITTVTGAGWSGIAVDAAGNLFIADSSNRVRRLEATTGIITTVAGNGTAGFSGDGGPATTASFNSPFGVAIDAAGNLYIADQNNHRVRRVQQVAAPVRVDTDGDGLSDADERALGTDPFNPDTDHDGLPDGAEVALGTNPLNPDTDGDGLLDGDEQARGTNPLSADSDADGLNDGFEVSLGSNPLSADTDGDGIADADELGDPNNPTDTDGDGVPDVLDAVDDRTTHFNPATGHFYEIVDAFDWRAADAMARLRGGSLVTIDDADEQQWLLDNFSFTEAFIGLNDASQEGDFQWASGESLADTGFTNWTDGEPSSATSDSDFVRMNAAGEWLVGEAAPASSSGSAILEYPPPTISLDPRRTYLHVDAQDAAPDAVPIRLADYGIKPGDTLSLMPAGDWQAGQNVPPDTHFTDTRTSLVGVFSATNVLLSADQPHRVPDAIAAGHGLQTQETCLETPQPTDIPEDFGITPRTSVVVPEGAVYLFLSVNDCYFQDNRDPDFDFGLNLVTGAPALSLAARVYNFDDTLDDERGGPAMVASGTASFEHGAFLLTGDGNGLSLDNGVLPSEYSIDFRYKLDPDPNPGDCVFSPTFGLCRHKLVDFADRSSAKGVYQITGFLDPATSAFLFVPGSGALDQDGFHDLLVTRNGQSNVASFYLDGAMIASILDYDASFAFTSPSAVAHFFMGDLVNADDPPVGSVDQIQIFDRQLSAPEALALSLIPDADGDAVPDATDNCPAAFNVSQTDSNVDGYGDACVDPSVTIPADTDVDPTASVGAGTQVNTGVSIGAGTEIGSKVDLNRNASVGADTTIGNGTVVAQGASIGSNVVIGSNVSIAKDVIVQDGAVIGDDTMINQGVVICANAQIGARVNIGKDSLVEIDGAVADDTNLGKSADVPGAGGSCLVP